MSYILFSIITALVSTFIAIRLLRPWALKVDLLDKPNVRKNHKGNVPLVGGLAMYIGVVVSLLITSNELSQFYYFMLATLAILIIGILDDFNNVNVSIRFVTQTLVALFIVLVVDINIESFGNLFGSSEIFLNELSYLVSVIAIIGAMNAINMSDGIHGLAGSTSLITITAILYLSLGNASQDTLLILYLFCAVIPVFLFSNLCIGIDKSKRVFMGDSGSMLLGLVIVWHLIILSQGGAERSFAPVTALWLFALPLIEVFTSITRRLILGKSPFKPDLSHSHHMLIRLGFDEKTTLLLLTLFSLLMAVVGVLGELYEADEWVMFLLFLLIFLTHLFFIRNIHDKVEN